MIVGIFHSGSGCGNQLFRYIATRVLALDYKTLFSMVAPELFKGSSFMKLDMGEKNDQLGAYTVEEKTGKVIPNLYRDGKFPLWEEKTNYYNPEFNFLYQDPYTLFTYIDGEFQDERYFGHRLKEVNEWLKVEPIDIPDDTCVIGFRGGEYALFPDLFLPKNYWQRGIEKMRGVNPAMKFEVHTDDEKLAFNFFSEILSWPDFKVIHDIGINWRSVRSAKYAIIANSSFYIIPRLLNGGMTIAPHYWAGYNRKEWSMPQNYYSKFDYI